MKVIYFRSVPACRLDGDGVCHTFIPYCNFATIGLSEMKVKSFRLHVNGSGTMSIMKMVISATSRRNTYDKDKGQQAARPSPPSHRKVGVETGA